MKPEDVVIIGAGPAGAAAAVQLKRYGMDPILVERQEVGGLLRNAHRVENYPGFPDGIGGMELVGLLEQHLSAFGISVQFEDVKKITSEAPGFQIHTNMRFFLTRVVVLATGTIPKTLDNVSIIADAKSRVYHEVYPIRDVKEKRIVVIGAGDAAFDYALHLAPVNEVVILNRNHRTRCLPLLWHRAMNESKITYKEDTQVQKIQKEKDKLILKAISNNEPVVWTADYVLVAVGRNPCFDLIDDTVRKHLDRWTAEGRIYLIGDVRNGLYRQASISVGDGVRAAMQIYEHLGVE
jgi:thioredoxin reductase